MGSKTCVAGERIKRSYGDSRSLVLPREVGNRSILRIPTPSSAPKRWLFINRHHARREFSLVKTMHVFWGQQAQYGRPIVLHNIQHLRSQVLVV